jgi:hypothetical protein
MILAFCFLELIMLRAIIKTPPATIGILSPTLGIECGGQINFNKETCLIKPEL